MVKRGWLKAFCLLPLAIGLADLLGRALGWGAWGDGPAHSRRVALTFDDGPSEQTPALLEILARHRVQATFFVTRAAALHHPELMRAIHEAGHQLESHGIWHRSALLLWPWQEWAQLAWHPRAGEGGPHFFRPPYGGHSPWTRLLARLLRRRIVLWNLESRDWTAQPAETLVMALSPQLQGGQVILLHDGPAVTPELLDQLLPMLKGQGLQAVRLDQFPLQRLSWSQGRRRLLRSYGS